MAKVATFCTHYWAVNGSLTQIIASVATFYSFEDDLTSLPSLSTLKFKTRVDGLPSAMPLGPYSNDHLVTNRLQGEEQLSHSVSPTIGAPAQ